MPATTALALSDGVSLFELAAPIAVFGAEPPPGVDDWYDLRVCTPAEVRVDRWFTSSTAHSYDDLIAADTVVVPACHDGALRPPPDLVAAVRAAHDRGARVISICTGAFVLAEAGILDGRRAATHWEAAELLRRRYPRIEVDDRVLYVDDGDVLTSAGKSAGMDLCLHVVRRDHGAGVANALARHLVTGPHRSGGQAQFIRAQDPEPRPDDLGALMSWALEHLDQPFAVDQLARRANVSPRTLNRHFHERVGTGPLRWIHQQRVRRAQELLERGDVNVDEVARASGFGTPEALRRHFTAEVGATPSAYRASFAGVEASELVGASSSS